MQYTLTREDSETVYGPKGIGWKQIFSVTLNRQTYWAWERKRPKLPTHIRPAHDIPDRGTPREARPEIRLFGFHSFKEFFNCLLSFRCFNRQ
jgi:hypothetical protein